jgi:choline dehydrogenase
VTLDDADGLLNALRWFVFNSGPLTSNVAEGGGFFRSDADRPAPDLQFHFGRSYFKRHGFDNPETGHAFSVGPTLLAPESAGRIELASADPLEHPLIDPQYLSEGDEDLAVAVDELRVHGVDGLRVVDASIMPTVPLGFTNIPRIMVAERAAEFVRG